MRRGKPARRTTGVWKVGEAGEGVMEVYESVGIPFWVASSELKD